MLYTQHEVGELFYIIKDEKSLSRSQGSLSLVHDSEVVQALSGVSMASSAEKEQKSFNFADKLVGHRNINS